MSARHSRSSVSRPVRTEAAPPDADPDATEGVATLTLHAGECAAEVGHTMVVDLGLTLRPGTADSWSVLVLRCVRNLAWVVLWIGLIVLVVSHRLNDPLTSQLATPTGLLKAAGTPLFGVALALVLRVAVAVVALALAAPLALRIPWGAGKGEVEVASERWNRWVVDRWQLASALRSARWTFAVRSVAVERVGPAGKVLTRCETVLGVMAYVIFTGFVILAIVAA